MLEALKIGCSKESALVEVEKTLEQAQEDHTVMKGLIQFLNWQDKSKLWSEVEIRKIVEEISRETPGDGMPLE